jgi:phosphonate ABC transporter permease subunit PhnE
VKKYKQLIRSLSIGLIIIIAVVIYAYGFEVTRVNLDETRSPRRQEQLVRIIRALARPAIVEYDQEEIVIRQPVMVPCPPGGFDPAEPNGEGPYLVVEPACAEPGDMVVIRGFDYEPGIRGNLSFIPPSQVTLRLAAYVADENGQFNLEVRLPRRPDTAEQHIQTITSVNVGAPRASLTAIQTWDKIVETVFLALLATTIGTLLAVPLSFFAAKNIMKDVKSPLIGIALNLLLIPVGVALGIFLSTQFEAVASSLSTSIWVDLVGMGAGLGLFVTGFRWAMPPIEAKRPSLQLRLTRLLVLLLATSLAILGLFFFASLSINVGRMLQPALGGFGFIGKFITDMGDILQMVMVVLLGMAGAGVLSSIGDRIGKGIVNRVDKGPAKLLSMILSAAAGALILILIMAGVNWFYQIDSPAVIYYWPAALGAVAGLAIAAWLEPKDDLHIGIVIYYISRTIFNALRSIEALVWVIVFVVWVGIGPFAGVLALSLHTIAALAKLYSEQVESILPGPLEAITATGANRIQTIIYGVIPQIVPPYISFTMYRWDINVRMSTIIGFAGGGGIGLLLFQNINLLNYRAASAQMLAIAIVVAAMDYFSAKMREKVI